tara:strand:+ start:265 stop:381 length:117 start_codon:yes stop_codon:yes gene_type:complete
MDLSGIIRVTTRALLTDALTRPVDRQLWLVSSKIEGEN